MRTRLPTRTENLVIGAGPAGLAMSWHLQRAGRDHALLERRPSSGGGWQDRWDAFRLVTPNWTLSLPDAPYDGNDPDGFMPRDEIIGRIAAYADRIGAPVVPEAGVERLRQSGPGWIAETAQGPVEGERVIVATGGFHRPHIPPVAESLPPHLHSLHAHDYRREADLPSGAVLVVGTGQTGVQLVEELMAEGREVYVCVGSAGRVPRRYRGSDILYWFARIAEDGPSVGAAFPAAAELPDPRGRLAANPQLSGHRGGHAVDLRQLSLDGAVLLGRFEGVEGSRLRVGPDLHDKLDAADRFFDERFKQLIDDFIAAAGVDAPPPEPQQVLDHQPPLIDTLDLDAAGVTSVLWTSGYRQDLSWIAAPVTDALGFALQDRGIGRVPGLFFIGGLWQHDLASASLIGIKRDAPVLADRMGLTAS